MWPWPLCLIKWDPPGPKQRYLHNLHRHRWHAPDRCTLLYTYLTRINFTWQSPNYHTGTSDSWIDNAHIHLSVSSRRYHSTPSSHLFHFIDPYYNNLPLYHANWQCNPPSARHSTPSGITSRRSKRPIKFSFWHSGLDPWFLDSTWPPAPSRTCVQSTTSWRQRHATGPTVQTPTRHHEVPT